ncbi:MAG: ParB/RepB/Spo0J family partition protein [Syntrophus sp. (in: bacteria)]
MAAKYVKGRLYKLNIADLQPDPNQARKYMDTNSLAELSASIKKSNVLVPIQFCQNDAGQPMIVSGHRRVKAAEMAGLTEIPGTYTDGDTRLQGFVDNLQREGLLPVEEAEQMEALMKEYTFNQYQLADAMGKGQSTVSETLSLNKLPEDIRNAARTNANIPKSILLDVAKMKSDLAMRRKFESYMAKAGKALRPTDGKQKLSKERALIVKMDELSGKMAMLDIADWKGDDRNDLAGALAAIRDKADELLNSMAQ